MNTAIFILLKIYLFVGTAIHELTHYYLESHDVDIKAKSEAFINLYGADALTKGAVYRQKIGGMSYTCSCHLYLLRITLISYTQTHHFFTG